jgi:hypothetical protein
MEHASVRMVAQSPFDYAERRLAAGQEFDCDPRHAKLLKIVGKVRDPDRAVPGSALGVAPAKNQKRAYRRRDMGAE